MANFITIDAAGLDTAAAYRLIVGCVVPRPVAWITTVDENGRTNASPFSSYNYVAHSPPMLAVNIGWLLSGSIVVEYVFSLPGLGSLLVRSVGFRDYPVIQGTTLLLATMFVLVNLIVDIMYGAIDPRIRYAAEESRG